MQQVSDIINIREQKRNNYYIIIVNGNSNMPVLQVGKVFYKHAKPVAMRI